MSWSKTEPVRLWLYGLMGPLMALLVGYGVLSDAQASMWIAVGVAVAGVGFGTEFARSKATPAEPAEPQLPSTGSVG